MANLVTIDMSYSPAWVLALKRQEKEGEKNETYIGFHYSIFLESESDDNENKIYPGLR